MIIAAGGTVIVVVAGTGGLIDGIGSADVVMAAALVGGGPRHGVVQ
jgi:hypothetical protein